MRYAIWLFTSLLCTFLLISCSSFSPATHAQDNLVVTGFAGERVANPDTTNEFTYIETGTWQAPEGALCAYRLSTTDHQSLAGFATDAEGWVLQATTKGDSSIWSDNHSFCVRIASQNGTLPRAIYKFEVQCRLADGTILTADSRNFRVIGTTLSTAYGNPDGQITGQAVTFTLNEQMNNLFTDGMYAHHFMYRLSTVDSTGTVISSGQWYNTLDNEDIRVLSLSPTSTPALTPNAAGQLTRLEAYVVARNGFSDSDNPATVTFTVSDQFHPNALIYTGVTCLLGSHHYDLPRSDTYIPSMMAMVNGQAVYRTNFFKDCHGMYSALWSSDLSIRMILGYNGQYEGNTYGARILNHILDEAANHFYYAGIADYEVQLDNLPLPTSVYGGTVVDGWTCLSPSASTLNLTGLSVGTHTLRVRVRDTQGAVDLTPAEYVFQLVSPVAPADKQGVLVIDDDLNHPTFCPRAEVDAFYNQVLADWSPVTVIHRDDILNSTFDIDLHWGGDALSPTDLEPYRLVLFHSDNGDYTQHCSFSKESDVFNLYLAGGGNVMLSAGANFVNTLYYAHDNGGTSYTKFFDTYFGLPVTNMGAQCCQYLMGLIVTQPWFLGADPVNTAWPAMGLNFSGLTSTLGQLISGVGGYGTICTFPAAHLAGAEPIYTFRCKAPNTDSHSPNESNYTLYNGAPVGIRNTHAGSTVYLFGCPLSALEPEAVRAMLDAVQTQLSPSGRHHA